MDAAPVVMIATARLLLRPFTLADVPRIFALSREDALRRWLPDQVYQDEEDAAAVLRALIAHTAAPPDPRVRPYVLAIEHDRAVVGHAGLSPARGSVEVGYAIEARLHGQGLATEAVTAISTWALDELGLPEVLGIVDAENRSSRRVLEKAGFARSAEEVKQIDGRATTLLVHRRSATLLLSDELPRR
jgi:ribosomal-protein-alanine N-acetyltransferase